MIWLTRITIPQREALKLGLTSCYAWHQLSWKCFPERPNSKRDFLLRVDQISEKESVQMYVLSQHQPVRPMNLSEDWWESKPVREEFLCFQKYRFSLKANPTKIISEGGRKIRQAILDREGQIEWLLRKAEQSGFAIDQADLVHIKKAGEHRIRCGRNSALCIGFNFEGILTVTDREKFSRAFISGIGKSKAFGFGMLMVIPMN